MATLATVNSNGNVLRYAGGIGVNSGDVVVQSSDVTRFDTFMVGSQTGVMEVFGSIDGTNYTQLALEDITAASTTGQVSVTSTTAAKLYRLRGSFAFIQVQQNGATAVTGATLICSKWGRQGQ